GEALSQLRALSGRTHSLFAAVVVYRDGLPLWRHVGTARLTMRDNSASYLNDYVERNWHSIRESVGAYKLEEEGVRLVSRIEGDHFTILGLPLIELLTWLAVRGDIASGRIIPEYPLPASSVLRSRTRSRPASIPPGSGLMASAATTFPWMWRKPISGKLSLLFPRRASWA